LALSAQKSGDFPPRSTGPGHSSSNWRYAEIVDTIQTSYANPVFWLAEEIFSKTTDRVAALG
jgi:hypothetical protein|tara:strand:+ start:297 stop:482 length:186 start_codon:yes stop_codon:yes gene_type:complete